MADNKPKSPGRGKRHGRRKASVTNVNIFALAAPERVPGPEPVQEPEERDDVDEPFFSSEALERRSTRLDAIERELRERAEDLERREAELDAREARIEADLYLREDAVEARERELAELDERLRRRETELGSYVARVQGDMFRSTPRFR
jgi:septal ring factor EnvC (AmiA/AmiB activator)